MPSYRRGKADRRVPGLALAWLGMALLAAGPPRGEESKPPRPANIVAKPAYLDSMIQEAWQEAGIKPSPMASDAEYLRRVYLDIVGRIPSVQEAVAFLETKDAHRREKLVEHLLASPDYAKNFGTIWEILLVGRKRQERDVDKEALRNWLRRQFAENRPWNELAYDLITATGSNKENGAVNYTLAHLEFGAVPLTSITTRVFLGQQLQCTQCHDHPTNDWKQRDFWGINAFFKGIKTERVEKTDSSGAEVYDHTELRDEPTAAYSTYERRNAYVEIAFPTFIDGRKISQGTDVNRREALGKFITEPENDQFARAFVNRMWAHFLGRGFVHPVDDFGPHNEASHPELLDKLAADFKASGYDIKTLIRWITSSRAYNLSSAATKENEKDETLFSHMAIKPMTPEQLFDSLLVATQAHQAGGGDHEKRREQWLKKFIFTFANDEEQESSIFQGTIPQALMMMNGDLMEEATGGKPGSFLAKLLDQARAQRRVRPDVFVINHLFLAALSRQPTAREMTETRKFLGSNPDPIGVIEDIFWALLNSNEFILNH
ncbi:MAG: DUF1553 domain-containing protein [Isosphaeraceae bacterium]|nr:DUF1553 domain-containing protein [Isosphaeraceae bacterium]